MSSVITWELEKRIILCKYIGNLTLEVVNEAAEKTVPFIERGERPIHILIDMQEMTSILYSIQESAARKIPFDVSALGWVVYVGSKENVFYQFMASALAQYRGLRIRWFESKAEALAFLKEIDESLPDFESRVEQS